MPRKIAESLIRHELWLVALPAGAAFLDVRLLLPACMGALLFWPLRKLATGAWTRRTPADLPVLLILLSAAVSLAVSALPEISYPQVLRLLTGLALFYAAVNWTDNEDRLRLLCTGLIAAGVALGVLAFFSVDWDGTKFPFIPETVYNRIPTLVSDVVHPNVLGGTLLLSAPLAAAVVLWGGMKSRWLRWLGAAAFFWMASVLVLSQSRGALLGLGIAVLVLVAFRWRWGWLGFVAAIAGLVWAIDAFGSLNLADLLFGSRVFGGVRGRMEIWGRGIFMLQDFPFTGIGMGLFPMVVDRIYPFFSTSEMSVLHAHNLFIQIGIDLGIPGLIAWLAVFVSTAWTGWTVMRSGERYAGMGAGVLAVQVALTVHGLFDAVIWGQVRGAPLVWLVWGFAMAVWNLHTQERRSRGGSKHSWPKTKKPLVPASPRSG